MKILQLKTGVKQRKKEGVTMNNGCIRAMGQRAATKMALGLLLASVAAWPTYAQWYFEVGPIYRGDMEVSVKGGSRAAASGMHAAQAGTGGGRAPAAQGSLLDDDGTAQMLRTFDDGYVGPSGWQWAREEGWTQFLGYNSPEQYNAAADTLTYQLTTPGVGTSERRTETRRFAGSPGWSDERRAHGVGLMGTLGYLVRQEESWGWAIQTRIGWLDGIQTDFRNREAYRETTERSVYETSLEQTCTYTYTYDTLGNPAFPAAPYEMTDPAAVGPMIADTPATITRASQTLAPSERLIGRSRDSAVSRVDLSVDAQAFTMQLGTRMQWHPIDRVTLFVQPAATLNLLDASVRRQETFSQDNGARIASWDDREDEQAWRFGIGAQAGLQIAVTDTWRLFAAGGYDWVDDYRISVGPDRIGVDLSGYEAELGIGRSF